MSILNQVHDGESVGKQYPNAYGYGNYNSLSINNGIWKRLKNAGKFVFGNWGKLVVGPKQSEFPKQKLPKEDTLAIDHLRDN